MLLLAASNNGRRWWSYVEYLASDSLEGRNTGSEGYLKAAKYVAAEFERDRLKPAGTSGYMQPVKFRVRQIVEDKSSLGLVTSGKVEPVKLGEEANLGTRNESASHIDAPMVFTGYGIAVPEYNYDDLKGLDLKGKIAVYISGGPANIPPALKAHAQSAAERWKRLKAAGVIGTAVIQNPKAMDVPWERATLARLSPSMDLADPALEETAGQQIGVAINPAHADKFFAASGHKFSDLLALVDAGKPLPRFPMNASLRATVTLKRGAKRNRPMWLPFCRGAIPS